MKCRQERTERCTPHRKARRTPHFVRHQLWRQIYFGFMAVVVLLSCAAGLIFSQFKEPEQARFESHLVPLLIRLLPPEADAAQQAATLGDIAATVRGSAALYRPDGQRIAAAGGDMPSQVSSGERTKNGRFKHLLTLPDGRLLMLRWGAPRIAIAAWIGGFALLVALGTWPVARRLTRRLERLQGQADAWGEGKLATRMSVDGCDEVSELARRFNQAAERVEALVSSQRAMLAAASHELRSPLARIRMAVDLLGESPGQARPDMQQQIEHDIHELDVLIGDILLASRLADDSPQMDFAPLDLLGLAAEEAARANVPVTGSPAPMQGDARLLRHLIRNLLDNARRYAPADSVEVQLERTSDDAIVLQVLDRGPGVPEAEREKIFEPFYRLAGSAERGDGAGYGLALVRRIARLHGGTVQCLGRYGGGSCFSLNLPMHNA